MLKLGLWLRNCGALKRLPGCNISSSVLLTVRPALNDPVVAGNCCADPPHTPLLDDNAVRTRIYECYYAAGGRKYENELPSMLPRSNTSVFSHVDIGPRNIMFDPESLQITGIIDWERAGWYPDYWEYSNIMRPCKWKDW